MEMYRMKLASPLAVILPILAHAYDERSTMSTSLSGKDNSVKKVRSYPECRNLVETRGSSFPDRKRNCGCPNDEVLRKEHLEDCDDHQILDLSNCDKPLTRIENNAFAELCVQDVRLIYNDISSLPRNIFCNTTIKRVYLIDNPAFQIRPNQNFTCGDSITLFDLSYTSFNYVPGIFSAFKNLKVIKAFGQPSCGKMKNDLPHIIVMCGEEGRGDKSLETNIADTNISIIPLNTSNEIEFENIQSFKEILASSVVDSGQISTDETLTKEYTTTATHSNDGMINTTPQTSPDKSNSTLTFIPISVANITKKKFTQDKIYLRNYTKYDKKNDFNQKNISKYLNTSRLPYQTSGVPFIHENITSTTSPFQLEGSNINNNFNISTSICYSIVTLGLIGLIVLIIIFFFRRIKHIKHNSVNKKKIEAVIEPLLKFP